MRPSSCCSFKLEQTNRLPRSNTSAPRRISLIDRKALLIIGGCEKTSGSRSRDLTGASHPPEHQTTSPCIRKDETIIMERPEKRQRSAAAPTEEHQSHSSSHISSCWEDAVAWIQSNGGTVHPALTLSSDRSVQTQAQTKPKPKPTPQPKP